MLLRQLHETESVTKSFILYHVCIIDWCFSLENQDCSLECPVVWKSSIDLPVAPALLIVKKV